MTDTTPVETKVLQEVLETLDMHAHNAGTVIHAKLAYDKLNRVLNGKPAPSPVRTKDLTDDDLEKTYDEICRNADSSERLLFRYARAVIAADREKNK